MLNGRRRLALVIGSQCEALGPLSFLPPGAAPVDVRVLATGERLLVELRDLLVGVGECAALSGVDGLAGDGLLLNPTQEQARAALRAAISLAQDAEAVLVVWVLAHGSGRQLDPAQRPRHLVHVWDTIAEPLDDEPESRGWDPYADVARRLPNHPEGRQLAGLVMVIDTCNAAWAKTSIEGWWGIRGGPLSAVLAASGDGPAWDACLTRTLVQLLKDGVSAAQHPRRALTTELLVVDVEPLVAAGCPHQTPHLHGYQSHNPVLFLARNQASDELARSLGLDAATAGLMLRLLRHYTGQALTPVADAIAANRLVCVTGKAGSGKSTLAAALRNPPTDEVPIGLISAAAFAAATPAVSELARSLAGQLTLLPGFDRAAARFARANQERWDQLDVWQRELIGPLSLFQQPVRLLIDGADQLDRENARVLARSVAQLLEDAPHAAVVITSRTDPGLPGEVVVPVPPLDADAARRYLTSREIDAARHDALIKLADGRWLVLELAADQHAIPLAGSLGGLYDELVDRARDRQGPITDAVLRLLAAAGSGPVLPIDVLAAALDRLRPTSRGELLRILGDEDLYRVIDRAATGTAQEHAGLFHETLRQHIQAGSDLAPAHQALAEALDEHAPDHNPKNFRDHPAHAYAFDAQPRHWSEAGHPEQVAASLSARTHVIPRVNLTRWQQWFQPLSQRLGPEHPETLATRGNIAYWTGQTGDARGALDLFRALLPDLERVLGPEHPATLTTRGNIARWTGQTGDARGALDLSRALLPDLECVLGPEHRDTLTTRANIAHWTGETGDARGALDLYRALLPDRERVRGPEHPDTLSTRANIAHLTGETGDARGALDLYRALLPDRERVLGPEHPATLTTRANIAGWTGQTGDARGALDLSRALLPDRERVLGPEHPATLSTRADIAGWTGETGDARGALDLFRALLPDLECVLGPEHPATLTTRADIARWTGETGDARGALDLSRALLPDLERVLGPEHPATLTTRADIAHWTGETGDARGALDLSRALLPDLERVLGPEHPATLTTRADIAGWTGQTGDARGALDLYRALLPDRERVLGPEHPATLTTRGNIAGWTGQTGDARGALDLFRALLPDLERVLGPEHPATLTTRGNIAHWTREIGDAGDSGIRR